MTTDPQTTQREMTLNLETLTGDASRRKFLTTLFAGAAAATAVAAAPASVFASTGLHKFTAASVPTGDAEILNFALTLEHLEARFYTMAAQRFPGGSYMSQLVRTLRFDENAHVNGLTAAIKGAGYTPVAAAPKYNFPNVFGNKKAFLSFAATVEDAGVHAYLGQAANIKTPEILLTAATIVTVEARHTGAVRAMLHRNPTDGPFDKGLTKEQILAIAGPLIGR